MMWHGFGGFWFMPLIGLVVLGLIIWLIVVLVRRGNWAGSGGCCGSSPVSSSESPLDILKKRYARGEINKQEYEDRKKDLM